MVKKTARKNEAVRLNKTIFFVSLSAISFSHNRRVSIALCPYKGCGFGRQTMMGTARIKCVLFVSLINALSLFLQCDNYHSTDDHAQENFPTQQHVSRGHCSLILLLTCKRSSKLWSKRIVKFQGLVRMASLTVESPGDSL